METRELEGRNKERRGGGWYNSRKDTTDISVDVERVIVVTGIVGNGKDKMIVGVMQA